MGQRARRCRAAAESNHVRVHREAGPTSSRRSPTGSATPRTSTSSCRPCWLQGNRPRVWHVEPALLRAVYPPRLSCGSREAGTRSAARSEEWSSRARRSSPRPKRTLPGLTLLSDTSVACVGHSGDDVPCLVADWWAPGACHRPEGLVSQLALTRASTQGPLPTVVDPGGNHARHPTG